MIRTLLRILAIGTMAGLSACQTTTRIADGPLVLGPTAIEVSLTPVLRTWGDNKSLVANIEAKSEADRPLHPAKWPREHQMEKALYYLDGRRIVVQVVLVLEGGELLATEGRGGCNQQLCGVWFSLPLYKRQVVIEKLRITASDTIVIRELEFLEGDSK